MFDARTNLCQLVALVVRSHFQDTFERVNPRCVRLSAAPSHGLPINRYDGKSSAAKAYAALADEVIDKFVPAYRKSAEAKR
jgi:chromosome partitioning protein